MTALDKSEYLPALRDAEPLVRELLRAQDAAAKLRYALVATQSELDVASRRIELLEGSVAFGLGAALVKAMQSLRGVVALPAELWRVVRRRRRRDGACAAAPSRGADMAAPSSEYSLTATYFSARRSRAQALRELRLAVVMDPFTLACFKPECELLELRNEGFEDALTAFMPHMLLVESAWRGLDGSWRDKIHPASSDLRYLVDCCRRRGIPTVFWNKEDPAHFDHFIEAAGLFDHVFTTDADCIPRYREALGHDRVGLLAFGCQPKVHHPVENFERRAAASFAGSWYHQYPDRCRDFDEVMRGIGQLLPVDIYDRNADRADPRFEFPPRYKPMLRGALSYDQIDRAYKGYDFAININTITSSTSMFARRVYELMASNTLVISNHAKALAATFGELVISGEAQAIATRLGSLVADVQARDRLRLRALRAVLREHTCAHRLSALSTAVLQQSLEVPTAAVTVIAEASDVEMGRALIAAFQRQSWPARRLVLVVDAAFVGQLQGDLVSVIDSEAAAHLVPTHEWQHQWLSPWHADDHYGDNYLADLALATGWIDAQAIGKSRHYLWADGAPQLVPGKVYAANQPLWLRSSLVRADALGDRSLGGWLERVRSQHAPDLHGLAVDEFNYCTGGRGHAASAVDVN